MPAITPTVIIRETGPVGSVLDARDVDDLAHVRRLLLQAVMSVEGEEGSVKEHVVPLAKLALLRGWLAAAGCGEKGAARRLLLMALLQLEDEDDARRFVMPRPTLPVIAPGV